MGRGPIRTGVTVIIPHDRVGTGLVFAGAHRLNGNGELTGLEWVRESGLLSSPVGREIPASNVPLPRPSMPSGAGSIIVVVGTDAPLLPHQCERLAQRAGLGVARAGGAGEHSSGDLFLAFSTGNADRGELEGSLAPKVQQLEALADEHINELFYAVIEATEEAIVSALLSAETMTGRDGNTAHRLDPGCLVEVMRRYGRLAS